MNDADRRAMRRNINKILTLTDELFKQLRVLGDTEEERDLTLRAFEGLTPQQLREAAQREKEYLKMHSYLATPPEASP